MSRERLDPKIFKRLQTNPRVNMTPQAIRNAISRIRSEHLGVTLNAAAAMFAQKKGFKIMRYLDEKDRQSLGNVREKMKQNMQKPKCKKIKVKKATVSFGKEFINEANKNAELYPYIYIVENSIRKMIQKTFQNDTNWWNNRVPKKIDEYAKRIKEAEKKHDWLPRRGDHPIYYVGLSELAKIIIHNYTHFKTIITDLNNFKTWINECAPIRNILAHNIKLRDTERQNVKIRSEYICTMIERNKA